jgi:hypothetical protein
MPITRDEFDKICIDQLHKVVLQLSGNCFELKKLCATLIVSAGTLIATFTGRHLDASLFSGATFITLFFWVLDSQSYYYQEKIRARMKKLGEDIIEPASVPAGTPSIPQPALSTPDTPLDGVGMPLSEERENRAAGNRILHAFFNGSMSFYWILIALFGLLAVLYWQGIIHTIIES